MRKVEHKKNAVQQQYAYTRLSANAHAHTVEFTEHVAFIHGLRRAESLLFLVCACFRIVYFRSSPTLINTNGSLGNVEYQPPNRSNSQRITPTAIWMGCCYRCRPFFPPWHAPFVFPSLAPCIGISIPTTRRFASDFTGAVPPDQNTSG